MSVLITFRNYCVLQRLPKAKTRNQSDQDVDGNPRISYHEPPGTSAGTRSVRLESRGATNSGGKPRAELANHAALAVISAFPGCALLDSALFSACHRPETSRSFSAPKAGENMVIKAFQPVARLAQWKSTSFTRKGPQVQVLQRAPFFLDALIPLLAWQNSPSPL